MSTLKLLCNWYVQLNITENKIKKMLISKIPEQQQSHLEFFNTLEERRHIQLTKSQSKNTIKQNVIKR